MKPRLIVLTLLGWSSIALAQAPVAPSNMLAPGNGGSQPPRGLSTGDVSGKWLLDANGAWIGRIEGSAEGGSSVTVRTLDGNHQTVSLSRLSLGNGPNTVIEAGNSEADNLNRAQLSSSQP